MNEHSITFFTRIGSSLDEVSEEWEQEQARQLVEEFKREIDQNVFSSEHGLTKAYWQSW